MPIVRHHHEQWDGLGYPDGLKGEQIPITARIISVVDCFDSVREDRPFRRGMTRDEAIAFLLRGAGNHFDPNVVELFIKHLPRFESQIAAVGLPQQLPSSDVCQPLALAEVDMAQTRERGAYMAYDQIKSAHQEVYALYEIARTFGSSLDVRNTVEVLVDKVGHVVPFDTCVVYLYDELTGYARPAHVVGRNAQLLSAKCFAPGEGVTGFALANRSPVNQLHPSLDFAGLEIEREYRSMASLPLFKDDMLLGALSVYSAELEQYTDDHMRLLETVTRLASDALSNAMHHAEAESNALTDPLTGLPNARYMALRFDEEASRARRNARPFQVVMLDLDDFKIVNDTFGHKVGDKMLREMGRIIQTQLREYDFLARYAGDEFVAIVQELVEDQVEDLRQRIEGAVSEFSLHVRGGGQARVGISVGTATYGVEGETLDQLLVAADQAMYRAKSSDARNCCARTHRRTRERQSRISFSKLALTLRFGLRGRVWSRPSSLPSSIFSRGAPTCAPRADTQVCPYKSQRAIFNNLDILCCFAFNRLRSLARVVRPTEHFTRSMTMMVIPDQPFSSWIEACRLPLTPKKIRQFLSLMTMPNRASTCGALSPKQVIVR